MTGTARHDSNTIIKFADDTTVITDNDETAYREEVKDLAVWCQAHTLFLNGIKTKEMIVDYRKRRTEHAPILIDGVAVEQGESFKFLGVHIPNKLTWSKHTKTGTTKPFPPQETEKIWHGSSDPQKFQQLHHREHTDWLHHCLVWNSSASARKALQRVLQMAQYITGAKLPATQDLYTRRCQRKALKIVKDSSMASGTRSAKSRYKRLLTSF